MLKFFFGVNPSEDQINQKIKQLKHTYTNAEQIYLSGLEIPTGYKNLNVTVIIKTPNPISFYVVYYNLVYLNNHHYDHIIIYYEKQI